MEYYKKDALANTSLFLFRRFAFSALIVFCGSSLVLQVFLADLLSMGLLIYFITVKPMVDTWNNLIQIVNELVVLICIVSMFQFSNYVPRAEDRYDLAYNFLYVVAVDIVLNIVFLIFTIVKKIFLACRGFLTRRKAKKSLDMNVLDQKNVILEGKTTKMTTENGTRTSLMKGGSLSTLNKGLESESHE